VYIRLCLHTDVNSSDQYSTMPIVAICSKGRHGGVSSPTYARSAQYVFDMYTLSVPIMITNSNINATIGYLGLDDCADNGVLDIFVVERKISPGYSKTELGVSDAFSTWTRVS